MSFKDDAKLIKDYVVDIRRELHANPELGLKLPKTMEILSRELKKLNIEHTVHDDISCIIGTLGKGEPCILLRADVDALPGVEESGLDFAPKENMHTCGHDMHGASLMGALKLLKEREDELKGTVKFLFQSGEEIFAGADAAIKKGVLENPKPDVAYASHVFAMWPLGEVYTGKEPMASVFGFKIIITGKGSHGSQPENGIDPINTAVQIYLALQSLIAREVPAAEEAALTIGELSAGNAANVIPERAVMQGTLRTFNPEVREYLTKRIKEVVADVAKVYRTEVEIITLSNMPPVISDEEFMNFCVDVFEKEGLADKVNMNMHLMGSEDFSLIAEQIPSSYFAIGAAPEEKEYVLPQHNPKIRFNEDALVNGAAMYAQLAYNYLTK